MGYRIELHTEHEDHGGAIAHFAACVEGEALMLPSEQRVPEGSWVAFEIQLADGSVFLEGMGRCKRSEEDTAGVLLGDLQLETTGELIFERLRLAREDLDNGQRLTGEYPPDVDADPNGSAARVSSLPPAIGVAVPHPSAPPPVTASARKRSAVAPNAGPAKAASARSWKPPPPSALSPGSRRPPPPLKASAPVVPKAPPRPVTAPPPPADLPLPLQERLSALLPLLQAEGRVRDMAGAHALVVEVGLQAVETLLAEE